MRALSARQEQQLKETTREYFTEAMEKKEAMLVACRESERRAVAKLKQLTDSAAAEARKTSQSDTVITELRSKLEWFEGAYEQTLAKLRKMQMHETIIDLDKASARSNCARTTQISAP